MKSKNNIPWNHFGFSQESNACKDLYAELFHRAVSFLQSKLCTLCSRKPSHRGQIPLFAGYTPHPFPDFLISSNLTSLAAYRSLLFLTQSCNQIFKVSQVAHVVPFQETEVFHQCGIASTMDSATPDLYFALGR